MFVESCDQEGYKSVIFLINYKSYHVDIFSAVQNKYPVIYFIGVCVESGLPSREL